MLHARQSLGRLSLLLALVAACGDSGEAAETDEYVCVEPPFIEGLNPDWAPCGCNHADSPWRKACLDAGNVCIGDVDGFTCAPDCTTDDPCPTNCGIAPEFPACPMGCGAPRPCPPYNDRAAICEAGTSNCYLSCGELGDEACPEGMHCSSQAANTAACVHDEAGP